MCGLMKANSGSEIYLVCIRLWTGMKGLLLHCKSFRNICFKFSITDLKKKNYICKLIWFKSCWICPFLCAIWLVWQKAICIKGKKTDAPFFAPTFQTSLLLILKLYLCSWLYLTLFTACLLYSKIIFKIFAFLTHLSSGLQVGCDTVYCLMWFPG